jgi:hypothetical protein
LLGKSFNAVKGEGESPLYVKQLDNAYIVWNLIATAPGLCKVLSMLPFKGLREFMGAGDYMYKVGPFVFLSPTLPC